MKIEAEAVAVEEVIEKAGNVEMTVAKGKGINQRIHKAAGKRPKKKINNRMRKKVRE